MQFLIHRATVKEVNSTTGLQVFNAAIVANSKPVPDNHGNVKADHFIFESDDNRHNFIVVNEKGSIAEYLVLH